MITRPNTGAAAAKTTAVRAIEDGDTGRRIFRVPPINATQLVNVDRQFFAVDTFCSEDGRTDV
jgi:hypothetical protein